MEFFAKYFENTDKYLVKFQESLSICLLQYIYIQAYFAWYLSPSMRHQNTNAASTSTFFIFFWRNENDRLEDFENERQEASSKAFI